MTRQTMDLNGNKKESNVVEEIPASIHGRDFEINCSIYENDMAANIMVSAASGECAVSKFDILCALHAAGVRDCVDYNIVRCIVAEKTYNREVVVAAGFPPEKGVPAEIKMMLKLEEYAWESPRAGAGKAPQRGVNVEAGQILAEKKLSKPGRMGVTVRGRRLEPKHGKDAKLKPGLNVIVSDDGLKLFAAIDGYAMLDDGKITVKSPDNSPWKEYIIVSADKMEAVLHIVPGKLKQPEYSEKWYGNLLKRYGIKFGIAEEAFKKIPKRIGKPLRVTVARGDGR